jgi:hypothetical protein
MASRVSVFRLGFLGLASAAAVGSLAIASSSLVACESLSETSPLLDEDAASMYDAGYVPPPAEEEASAPPPSQPDAEPPPPTGRVRLANLLQGPSAVDLCAKRDEPGRSWEPQKITVDSRAPKPEGLLFGEVSTHIFLSAAAGSGTKYLFRVVPLGSPCDGEGGAPLASIASTALKQSSGLTLVAFGVLTEGADAGDSRPKGVAIPDVVSPPSTATLIRAFHGVPDMPPFDLVINGETAATGVKYGSTVGYPYTSPTGFASLAAGIPDKAKLTLRAGTMVKSYVIPERVGHGVAMTVFAGGSLTSDKQPLTVSLCADQSPPEGEKLATCTKLQAAPE